MPVRDLLSAASGAGGATDPYFYDVSLLLNGDGTNGAQNNTFLDSSTNNFTITRSGNTTQGSFSPYGNLWSNNFNPSTTDWLEYNGSFLAGYNSNVTIECWFKLNATPSGDVYNTSCYISGAGTLNSNTGFDFAIGASVIWFNQDNYLSRTLAGSWTPNQNWNHIAVTRNSNTWTMWLNGTSIATATSSTPFTSTIGTTTIGRCEPTGGEASGYMNGYISNYRITNSCLYTSTFTPSTTPLTAISGVQVLTCQSNRFIDNSTNNFTLTVNGSPSVQRFSPFNPTAPYSTATIGGSGYFDGSSYLTTSYSNTNFDWYTSDYTLEAWVYPTTLSGWSYTDSGVTHPTLVGNRSSSALTDYWSFGVISTGAVSLCYYNGSGNPTVTSSATVNLNQWNHIAFTKTSSGVSVFVNGIGTSPTAISGSPQSSTGVPLTIGQGNNTAINGYVSNLRIVKGTAVYSGTTYTVPTAPLTAIANTQLLTNFTNAGIPDLAMQNDLQTVGSAQVSTSVVKYGTGSLSFNGSASYLVDSSNSSYNFGTGDFTVEGWIYIAGYSGYGPLIETRAGADISNWVLGIYSGYKLDFICADGRLTSASTVSTGAWVYIAVTRASGTVRLFINGVLDANTASFTSAINANRANPLIGAVIDPYYFNGYIDDLRITNGYARYTSNFTPPTSALPTY
jgi:hypothetical protein